MSEATLKLNHEPISDRKVRCDITNAQKAPSVYDLSLHVEKLAAIEKAAREEMRPRFLHRQCETPEPVYHPGIRATEFVQVLYCVSGQALLIKDAEQSWFLTSGSVVIIPP